MLCCIVRQWAMLNIFREFFCPTLANYIGLWLVNQFVNYFLEISNLQSSGQSRFIQEIVPEQIVAVVEINLNKLQNVLQTFTLLEG